MNGDLNIDVLLSISDNEKHLNVLYYHFYRYKIKRINSFLKSNLKKKLNKKEINNIND